MLSYWFLSPIAVTFYFIFSITYNIFFHPLAKCPGPFLASISHIPSFYHACKGDWHLWLWRCFQKYGNKFRATPNMVLFRSPRAHHDIYNYKANAKKSNFYDSWSRNERDLYTLNITDVALHAKRRRLLNSAFTEQSVRAAGMSMASHINRWVELLFDDDQKASCWSEPRDMKAQVEALIFDILGEQCFGESFETKEQDSIRSRFKNIPNAIEVFLKMMYPLTKSPLLDAVIWLKPRGLSRLIDATLSKEVREYYEFEQECVNRRLAAESSATKRPETTAPREDFFHFLYNAKDPDTNEPGLLKDDLLAEIHMLIIAGTHTTSTALTAVLFYISSNFDVYHKLCKEIRTTFSSTEEIQYGQKLSSCKYLRACIDETLRMAPPGPAEFPRQILQRGATVNGEYFPAGVIVGAAGWASGHDEGLYGDSEAYRPERWIESEANTAVDVARIKRGFSPFSKGPGNCVGQNLAILEMMMTIGRLVYYADLKLASTVSRGKDNLGWGRDPRHYQFWDAHIGMGERIELQFKKRN
ncbi:benzoate 4-monooxygenase cytochrome P450 [Zopfia rhizophila CBS 207.26]|uniref:Benzoate 4-monooxygenase cytochrome P450 n=1 Tax=Zopfia rhizophila CBS 207.26 TaxID=1314779 RepID=A0A6A6ESR7_9PEZI|nr:benzoate 4-monooxygenase cytochrome P450 [Zopfia rhizophila CBS 207.26]